MSTITVYGQLQIIHTNILDLKVMMGKTLQMSRLEAECLYRTDKALLAQEQRRHATFVEI